jgi:hypothetical protein
VKRTIETGIILPTYPERIAVVKLVGDDHLTVLHIRHEERCERITGGDINIHASGDTQPTDES